MHKKILVAIVSTFLCIPVVAQQFSSCQAVYQDSIRNVDIQSRILTEQRDLFNNHCENNGSLKSSSANLDLTIPVKALKIGFSGGQQEARQEMQSFCKSNSERLRVFDSYYQINNRVVVEALQSFNQCRALELKGVQIAHVATEARSLVVRVGFNPAEHRVTLNSVQYDPNLARCRSSINGPGQLIDVNSTSGQITASAPFSIVCDRIASTLPSGETKYNRFELLIDTNLGAYSLAMPTEGMLNYDLANANRVEISALTQEKIRLESENTRLNSTITSLNKKISGVKATGHVAIQGRGAAVACPQHGGNMAAHAANVCTGASVSGLTALGSRSGSTCGYTTFSWACVTIP